MLIAEIQFSNPWRNMVGMLFFVARKTINDLVDDWSPQKSQQFSDFSPNFHVLILQNPPMFGQICKFPQIFFPALHPLQTKFSETLPAGALRGRAPISSIAKRTSCFEKTPLAPDAVRMPPYKARPLELPKCGLNQHGTLVPLQSFPFIPDSYLYKFIWDHPQEHTHIF